MRIDQLGLFVCQRHFGPTHIQLPDGAGAESLLLRLHFLLHHGDRLFAHADPGAVQEQFVECDPHVHFHAVGDGLKFQLLNFEVQSCDRDLAADRAAGIKVFHHAQRRVVIFVAQARIGLVLALTKQSRGHDRGQITGTRLNHTAARRLDFLARNRNFRILTLRKRDRFFDAVTWWSCVPCCR